MSWIGTFFHKVGAVAKKLFGSTTWEKTAQSTITYVAPLLETIVQLAAGSGAETAVAKVISTVQSDLATVSAVVEGGATTDTHATAVVTTALGSIKDNMASILGLAEVKNSAKSTEISATVNLIVGEVDAMLGGLSAAPAAPAPAPALPAAQ